MKSCILSMQRVGNCGSLLQSYALKKMLEQCGCEVSFLDIEKNAEDNQLRKDQMLRFAENKRGILVKLSRLDRYVLNRLRIKKLAQKQHMIFEDFRRRTLDMCQDTSEEHFDFCVIGSDEVFNCMSETPWGFTSQLFGNVRQAERVITYAASCGATMYEDLPTAVAAKICEAFVRITAFSVRDRNTQQFVSCLTDKEAVVHFDPVVVSDFEQELQHTALPDGLPKKYCIVYSYYNRISDKTEIKAIKAFCRKHNLQIVAIGAPQMWIKNYLPMQPFEVLKAFQNAEFVITDTFHGTIFSAKFAKRFATMTRPSNANKLSDLIERLHLNKHQITSMDQLEETFAVQKRDEELNKLFQSERNTTLRYLNDSILMSKEENYEN